jgi:membrane protease YdiL (CAAX protease family)
MSNQASDSPHSMPGSEQGIAQPARPAFRAALFVVFLVCALAIFVFGSNYYRAFATNGSVPYSASLTTVFLITALWFKRSQRFAKYWQVAYAFFIASAVTLVSDLFADLFAGYNTTILGFLGVSGHTNQFLGLGKLYDALLVVIPILVLNKLAGADLGSLYLKKGNLKWGLSIGALVFINFLTSVLIFFAPGYDSTAKLGSAIAWGMIFAFSNGLLEELWMRGLFLKKLVPMIGFWGALLCSSAWFASLHLLSVSYLPVSVIPVFLVNTLTLGLACGYLMLKTDSIWGAVLIHAAADLFLFIALLAAH